MFRLLNRTCNGRSGLALSRPPAPEQFVSYESDIRFIKRGGRIFIVEVTTRISELKRTHNNVIQLPAKSGIPDICGHLAGLRAGIRRRSSSKKFSSMVTCTDPFSPAGASGIKNVMKRFPSRAKSDSWEHADNPKYPEKYSALGIRIGVNYIVYAMTH
jgi:hypothetical protein